MRTETTIKNARNFCIGKLLKSLPGLRQIGFRANQRLLDVQKVSHSHSHSHDRLIGGDAFDKVMRPIEVEVSAPLGCVSATTGCTVVVGFSLQLRGFTNREIRPLLEQLLGLDAANYACKSAFILICETAEGSAVEC